MVHITRLTEKEIMEYSGVSRKSVDSSSDNINVGGYTLRKRKLGKPRHDKDAKYNVNYTASTDDTSDEDYGQRKPPKCKFVAALSGPSIGRIAVQKHTSQHTQKEHSAVETMLMLGSDNNPPINMESEADTEQLSSEDNADSTSSGDSSNSVKPGSSSSNDSESVALSDSKEQDKDTVSATGNNNEVATPDEDNEPLSEIQKKL